MTLGVFDPEKIWQACTFAHTVDTWEIQKSHFSTALFIHISDYLRYLRKEQTVTPLPTTPKKYHRTTL